MFSVSVLAGLPFPSRQSFRVILLLEPFQLMSKGQSSRSPIIDPVNKSFETPSVNQFFSECCKCLLSELVFIFSI